jgi:hypothetical protein
VNPGEVKPSAKGGREMGGSYAMEPAGPLQVPSSTQAEGSGETKGLRESRHHVRVAFLYSDLQGRDMGRRGHCQDDWISVLLFCSAC